MDVPDYDPTDPQPIMDQLEFIGTKITEVSMPLEIAATRGAARGGRFKEFQAFAGCCILMPQFVRVAPIKKACYFF